MVGMETWLRTSLLHLPRMVAVVVAPDDPWRVETIFDAEIRRLLTDLSTSAPSIEDLGIVVDGAKPDRVNGSARPDRIRQRHDGRRARRPAEPWPDRPEVGRMGPHLHGLG